MSLIRRADFLLKASVDAEGLPRLRLQRLAYRTAAAACRGAAIIAPGTLRQLRRGLIDVGQGHPGPFELIFYSCGALVLLKPLILLDTMGDDRDNAVLRLR